MSQLRAERIFMVDHHAYRLDYAQHRSGVIPINFDDDEDPVDSIIRQTPGSSRVDGVIDAVVFEAKGYTTETVMTTLKLEGSSCKALRQSIAAVLRRGVVSVPGVYSRFIHGFIFGDAFDKGLTFKMGQTHVQRFLPELLEQIVTCRRQSEAIITYRLSLEQAAEGYRIFDKKQENCRKVILRPGSSEIWRSQVPSATVS